MTLIIVDNITGTLYADKHVTHDDNHLLTRKIFTFQCLDAVGIGAIYGTCVMQVELVAALRDAIRSGDPGFRFKLSSRLYASIVVMLRVEDAERLLPPMTYGWSHDDDIKAVTIIAGDKARSLSIQAQSGIVPTNFGGFKLSNYRRGNKALRLMADVIRANENGVVGGGCDSLTFDQGSKTITHRAYSWTKAQKLKYTGARVVSIG